MSEESKKKKNHAGAKLYRAANFDVIRKRTEERQREHEREKAEAIKRAAMPLHHVDSPEKTSFEKFRLEADIREMERRRRRLRLPGALIFWIFVALLGLGVWLRFSDLGEKPLHSDEAVQAWKLGELLEGEGYVYDPADHHGPTLYYFSALACRLFGQNSFEELTAPVLRFVPALFGAGLVASMLLWRRAGMRLGACGAALAFAAVSPAAVYYARYFIQETVLVACFWTAAALIFILYSENNYKSAMRIIIAILAGVLFGVATASKETWILMVPAVVAGGAAAVFFGRGGIERRLGLPAIILAGAGITAALFYSSFGKNLSGITDAIAAYAGYFEKSSGSAHDKPFWWYVPLLTAFRIGKVPFQTEALTLIAGIIFGGLSLLVPGALKLTERRILVFSLVSGVTLFVVYSFIGYKTPWLILGVLPPLWLAAGVTCAGYYAIMAKENKFRLKTLLMPVVGLALLLLFHGRSAYRLSTEPLASDERNLFAYVHTSPDVVRAQELAGNIASVTPAGEFRIFVFAQDDHRWPLPWYFRAWDNGYWDKVPADALKQLNVPVIITDDSTEAAVAACLNESDYVSDFLQLRPGVLLVIRLRADLHEQFMNRKLNVKEE